MNAIATVKTKMGRYYKPILDALRSSRETAMSRQDVFSFVLSAFHRERAFPEADLRSFAPGGARRKTYEKNVDWTARTLVRAGLLEKGREGGKRGWWYLTQMGKDKSPDYPSPGEVEEIQARWVQVPREGGDVGGVTNPTPPLGGPSSMEPTYAVIRKAALAEKWCTITDIAKAHGQGEKQGSTRWVTGHLNRLLKEAFKAGLPMLGAVVVRHQGRETGVPSEGEIEGMLRGHKKAGYDISNFDLDAARQEVYKWAKGAPETLEEARKIATKGHGALSLEPTYRTILRAARKRVLCTFKDIAEAHGRNPGRWVSEHMKKFLAEAFSLNMPMLGTIVREDSVVSDALDLRRMKSEHEEAGYDVSYLDIEDLEDVRSSVYSWAEYAPETLEDARFAVRIVESSVEARRARKEDRVRRGWQIDPERGVKQILSLEEKCFLPTSDIKKIFVRLRDKKNLILQGPPGTGKTWLAKKVAMILPGTDDALSSFIVRTLGTTKRMEDRFVRVVQFHPSYSYEDFVRGYRPQAAKEDEEVGRWGLTDGAFLERVKAAGDLRPIPIILVIEEINRGVPAQIFGELLTLIESTKRGKEHAMQLAYPKEGDGEGIYIPDNLYIIGTMNLADRSLARMDVALRRRFAFFDMKPQFNKDWEAWCAECGLPNAGKIWERVAKVNDMITEDASLGEQSVIGHSFFTPAKERKEENNQIPDEQAWFEERVKSEIIPLLKDYWPEEPEKVKEAAKILLPEGQLLAASAPQAPPEGGESPPEGGGASGGEDGSGGGGAS